MKSALIVSVARLTRERLERLLMENSFINTVAVASVDAAREVLLKQRFHLIIVNATSDGAIEFARGVAKDEGETILFVSKSQMESVTVRTQGTGVIVLLKPFSSEEFVQSVRVADAMQAKIEGLKKENARLQSTIDDLKLVSRAKCLLIECLHVTEEEAHRHIEKQAMDMRKTKREVAISIIRTYENV